MNVNNCMSRNHVWKWNGQIPRKTQTTEIDSRRNRLFGQHNNKLRDELDNLQRKVQAQVTSQMDSS